jgi:hypothetical protein
MSSWLHADWLVLGKGGTTILQRLQRWRELADRLEQGDKDWWHATYETARLISGGG